MSVSRLIVVIFFQLLLVSVIGAGTKSKPTPIPNPIEQRLRSLEASNKQIMSELNATKQQGLLLRTENHAITSQLEMVTKALQDKQKEIDSATTLVQGMQEEFTKTNKSLYSLKETIEIVKLEQGRHKINIDTLINTYNSLHTRTWEIVKSKSFVLIDNNGNRRASLAMSVEGDPYLWTYDKQGKSTSCIGANISAEEVRVTTPNIWCPKSERIEVSRGGGPNVEFNVACIQSLRAPQMPLGPVPPYWPR